MSQRTNLSIHFFRLWISSSACLSLISYFGIVAPNYCIAADDAPTIRVGVIGLDTSHSAAFTKELNKSEATDAERNRRLLQ